MKKEFLAFWGKGALASMQEAEVAFKGQGALTKGKKDTLPKGKGKGRAKSLLPLQMVKVRIAKMKIRTRKHQKKNGLSA